MERTFAWLGLLNFLDSSNRIMSLNLRLSYSYYSNVLGVLRVQASMMSGIKIHNERSEKKKSTNLLQPGL